MFNLIKDASDYSGMQRGFLTSYQNSVSNFLTNMVGIGRVINSPDFASVVQELKEETVIAFHSLNDFRKEISTNLLEVYPADLERWLDKLYQLICMQVQATLDYNIRSLLKNHPELFDFTIRDVCSETSRYMEAPYQMNNVSWTLNACELLILNKRFYNLLRNCIRDLEHRTDDDLLRIYNQRFQEYKKENGTLQINHLKQSCDRLIGNGKMTKAQFHQLYDSIFQEIEDKTLRYIVVGHIANPIDLVKTLQSKGYKEDVIDQVFCASIKLEELKRIFEQREEPTLLDYNQKLTAFLTACVQDIQAASYSKDGESLIRSSNEWFYVYRIFMEKKVKGLMQCKDFVNKLNELQVKVVKLPPNPQSLYKTGQEFKDRYYPHWAEPEGRIACKFQRFMELGGVTMKACERNWKLLM